jgi:hypothetical protein
MNYLAFASGVQQPGDRVEVRIYTRSLRRPEHYLSIEITKEGHRP